MLTRININELVKMIEKLAGKQAVFRYIEKQKGDMKDTLAETDNIKKLGWEPRVGISKGIGNFIEWYRKKG